MYARSHAHPSLAATRSRLEAIADRQYTAWVARLLFFYVQCHCTAPGCRGTFLLSDRERFYSQCARLATRTQQSTSYCAASARPCASRPSGQVRRKHESNLGDETVSAKQVEGTRAEVPGISAMFPAVEKNGFFCLRHDTQTRSQPFSHMHIHYSRVGSLRRRIRRPAWSSTEKKRSPQALLSTGAMWLTLLSLFCRHSAHCSPSVWSRRSLSVRSPPTNTRHDEQTSLASQIAALLRSGLAEDHGNSDPDFASLLPP